MLFCISLVGVFTFLTLRPTPWASEFDNATKSAPLDVFKRAFKVGSELFASAKLMYDRIFKMFEFRSLSVQTNKLMVIGRALNIQAP